MGFTVILTEFEEVPPHFERTDRDEMANEPILKRRKIKE